MRELGVAAMLVALAACGSSAAPGTQAPTTSGPAASGPSSPTTAAPERIAFTRWSSHPDHPKLWTADIDGSDPAPVGDHVGWFPDWSPDRTTLLFGFTDENADDQIAAVRPDGSDLTVLTEGPGYNEAPDYSPDGRTIVYAHSDVHEDHPDFGTTLWRMAADGSGERPLRLDDGGGDDTEPEYSPDGGHLVFLRYRHDAADSTAAHLVAADGSGVRRLTPWLPKVEHPRWSPDGRTIIYNIEAGHSPGAGIEGIWTVPASGGKPTQLLRSADGLHGFKPDFSPDGRRILFACSADRRNEDICVMDSDGTAVKQVISGADYFENHVVWD